MTKAELMALEPGTWLYNGRIEGVIRMDAGSKVIEIQIPVYCMSNDSTDFNERPKNWMLLD